MRTAGVGCEVCEVRRLCGSLEWRRVVMVAEDVVVRRGCRSGRSVPPGPPQSPVQSGPATTQVRPASQQLYNTRIYIGLVWSSSLSAILSTVHCVLLFDNLKIIFSIDMSQESFFLFVFFFGSNGETTLMACSFKQARQIISYIFFKFKLPIRNFSIAMHCIGSQSFIEICTATLLSLGCRLQGLGLRCCAACATQPPVPATLIQDYINKSV